MRKKNDSVEFMYIEISSNSARHQSYTQIAVLGDVLDLFPPALARAFHLT